MKYVISPSITTAPITNFNEWADGYARDRWHWIGTSPNSGPWSSQEFYNRYGGRHDFSIWMSEFGAGTSVTSWTPPLWIFGDNTQQAAPYNNVINMQNSKDGVTYDMLYLAGKTRLKVPCILDFDAKFMGTAWTTAQYPLNTYFGAGLEVNSSGFEGDSICDFEVKTTAGPTLAVQLNTLGLVDDSPTNKTLSVQSSIPTNAYTSFKLKLTKQYFEMYYSTVGGQGTPQTSAGRLYHGLDDIAWCQPFFFNESVSPTITALYRLGQWKATNLEGGREVTPASMVISQASIGAGSNRTSPWMVLPEKFAVQCNITYGASATAGVTVYVQSANTIAGTLADDLDVTCPSFTPTFVTNTTHQMTQPFGTYAKYTRIVVVNQDGANAQGAVSVNVQPLRGS